MKEMRKRNGRKERENRKGESLTDVLCGPASCGILQRSVFNVYPLIFSHYRTLSLPSESGQVFYSLV